MLLTRCIVVVNAHRQIARHIGHWIPTLNGEVYTDILMIKLLKINEIQH